MSLTQDSQELSIFYNKLGISDLQTFLGFIRYHAQTHLWKQKALALNYHWITE